MRQQNSASAREARQRHILRANYFALLKDYQFRILAGVLPVWLATRRER
jgi:hypothetical protein